MSASPQPITRLLAERQRLSQICDKYKVVENYCVPYLAHKYAKCELEPVEEMFLAEFFQYEWIAAVVRACAELAR